MFGKAIATLIASVIEHTSMFCDTRLMLGSFGANLLHLGNVDKQVYRRFLGLQTFHVKHAQGFQAKMCLHIFPHRG